MTVIADSAKRARAELKERFGDNALVDVVSRGLYSTDASVYQFPPVAVVTPRDEDDIGTALAVARKYHIPVTMRGGGTSLAGQTANRSIIVDVSKHMNKLLEVNATEGWARVQPGLVRDELNAALAPYGVEFAPETSTSNRANVGGMIGNNSSGMRSIRYGRTLEHVLETRVMFATGEVANLAPRSLDEVTELIRRDEREGNAEGRIWRSLRPMLEKNRALIEQRFPKVVRRVGGYSLDEFPPEGPWNLAKLMGGSEGTLAVLLDAKVKVVVPPRHVGMIALHYKDLIEGLRTVPAILKFDPLSVELMDGKMIALSRANPSTREFCNQIVGEPGVILVAELTGDSDADVGEALRALRERMLAGGAYAAPIMATAAQREELLELRRRGLGVSLSVPGDTKPVSWIEDACVPPVHLADYTAKVLDIAHGHGLDVVIYGHASVGVLHIKPALNLKSEKDLAAMADISRRAMLVCKSYGGSWSGEHGDGVARGAQNREFWGEEMYKVFLDVKRVFDPESLLNPNRIVESPPVNENLRYGTDYVVDPIKTHFRYEQHKGFASAVEMCNGVGACRKTLGGTMCPSYMATRNEEDTTRGRANALRLAMSGQLGPSGMTSERVHEVLDLCLECKACKSECPSNVDMAKMKSEHLAMWHEAHGASLRSKVFANAPVSGRLFSGPLSFFANAPMRIAAIRKMVFGFLGIAAERKLPEFAPQKFTSWWAKHQRALRKHGSAAKSGREVALFVDCWANYNETSVARWAVRVLEHCGYKVHIVADACCQRTRISKGFLKEAKEGGAVTVARLLPHAKAGRPILGLEPSCLSSITDDLPDLVENAEDAKLVASMGMPIEEFLDREIREGRLVAPEQKRPAAAYLVHGHCHQKAMFSTAAAKRLLLAGVTGDKPKVTEVDSGCCGMAGSFGYEAEHYDISRKIGERRLLPAVRATDEKTVLVANGFSCRHQVDDFAGRKPMHIIEVYGRALFGRWHRPGTGAHAANEPQHHHAPAAD